MRRRLLSRPVSPRTEPRTKEAVMRKPFKIALAAASATVVVSAAAYFWMISGDVDPMVETLREFGFVRIPLPSNLMNVGSLYYVDAGLKDFKTTCHARTAELGEDVIVSRSGDIQKDLERKGLLSTGVTVDFGSVVKGAYDNSYVHKVHFSLTEVVVEELPLDSSRVVYSKLMNDPACNDVALQYVNDAPRGYVCQVQKTLRATAEFKLDRDVQNKLETHAVVTDITGRIKEAVETQTNVSVVERDGRLFSGTALTYGVSMTPNCLAPLTSHFRRVLPQNRLDRFVNFVKFDIVEPFWPTHADQSPTDQKSEAVAKTGQSESLASKPSQSISAGATPSTPQAKAQPHRRYPAPISARLAASGSPDHARGKQARAE
jgi:hypothetical protein